jgi:hypothetical protein
MPYLDRGDVRSLAEALQDEGWNVTCRQVAAVIEKTGILQARGDEPITGSV